MNNANLFREGGAESPTLRRGRLSGGVAAGARAMGDVVALSLQESTIVVLDEGRAVVRSPASFARIARITCGAKNDGRIQAILAILLAILRINIQGGVIMTLTSAPVSAPSHSELPFAGNAHRRSLYKKRAGKAG